MKLTVADITFSYNSHPVLSKIHFHLDQGQVMAVLGINGAGKSTLIKCLNRILKPSGGCVLVNGKDLQRLTRKEIARRMGYVPQQHPETQQTVFELVLMGRKPFIQWGISSKDYEVVEQIIHQIGIAHLAMRPVCALSGGEVQKVIIARALAQCPDILLLDEPTSNLDLKNQLEVMGLIRRIVDHQGLSAVIAIHDLNMAVRFADRFLFLKEHQVHAVTDQWDLNPEIIHDVYGVRVSLEKFQGQTVIVPL